MRRQGIKHLLYTDKQPLQDQEKFVFFGFMPQPASCGDVNLPREKEENRSSSWQYFWKTPFIFQMCYVPTIHKQKVLEISKAFKR